jgi:hypothetical protein
MFLPNIPGATSISESRVYIIQFFAYRFDLSKWFFDWLGPVAYELTKLRPNFNVLKIEVTY